jgi:hypothetical protein
MDDGTVEDMDVLLELLPSPIERIIIITRIGVIPIVERTAVVATVAIAW